MTAVGHAMSAERPPNEKQHPSPAETPGPSPGLPPEDARLLDQVRRNDPDAGWQLTREYYAPIYRYLLMLTGRPDLAEDLTQETFLQAWRRLDTFEGRSPLRPWLHRIAHREFLQYLRRRRDESSLEETGELPAPMAESWRAEIDLRATLRGLPLEEREMVVLHYLEGYSVAETAQILGLSVSRVKFRLLDARARLRASMGEDDLSYLNETPTAAVRRWTWLPLEELTTLEARLSLGEGAWLKAGRDTSPERAEPATRPPARPPSSQTAQPEEPDMSSGRLSRREFVSQAAGASAAALAAKSETDVTDERLQRKLTLAFKATALSDLCASLCEDTGIYLAAGSSVADEKVTLFCRDMPLRDVMRQLSRPFGYTWLRTGPPYRYELVQDLKSQLFEEELRNRDRITAALVLEREIERFRPYLDLSPDEALARARTASPEDEPLLERLSRSGWGALQMYFRLTPQQHARLRAGDELHFSQVPNAGELQLPADIGRGVLQSLRDVFYHRYPDGFGISTGVKEAGEGDLPPTAVPEARASITLSISQAEPGRLALQYSAHTFSQSELPRNSSGGTGDGPLAIGASPAVVKPDNRAANARLAADRALQRRVSLKPEGHCEDRSAALTAAASPSSSSPRPLAKRATSADVLQALHEATGLPVVADFYTRLLSPASLTLTDQSLFDALNHLADTMHLRWSKDSDWLQFRSAGYYDDRLKEVPNRLLARWAASRKQHGNLSLDDLCEIADLSETQLDAADMAEGARDCWGLVEWRLPREGNLRRDLRFLTELTPAQRQEVMSPTGLPFTKLSLSQQQHYMEIGMRYQKEPLQSLNELEGAVVRVEYTRPGEYVWIPPGPNWYRWVVPIVPGEQGRRAVLPSCRGRSPVEARDAARRLDSRLLEAILPEARRLRPEVQTPAAVVDAGEVAATSLDVIVVFIPGLTNRRNIHIAHLGADYHNSSW
jgi:RNA polymerase sigma-70 factor, ECF subfamily